MENANLKVLYHILYPDGFGDDRFIYDGYRGAFEDLGIDILPVTERDSVAQKIENLKPDLFITGLNYLNQPEIREAIKEYRAHGGKVFCRVGDLTEEMIGVHFTKELIQDVRGGHLADVYYTEIHGGNFSKYTGKECKILPLAADKHRHFPVSPVKKYECDIVYIGANLPMKKEIFMRRLYPLFKKYKVRVFGGDWDKLDRYFLHPLSRIDRRFNLGGIFSRLRISRQVPLNEENMAYASAKIALNFHEQYKDKHIFLNARTFKIPASGGFEICDFVPVMREYFDENEMLMPSSDEDFFKKVDYYLNHEAERRAMQERATKKVLFSHTYHNRAETMLEWFRGLK